jgi:AcrR family transcriptional regulator
MPASVSALVPAHRGRPAIAGLRDNILRAAEVVFTRHDFHEVLMEDVARASGIAKGTVYRYFPSKRQLYLAVMFEGIEQLRDDLQLAVHAADTPARTIECTVRCILTHFWNRRFFFALIHRNEHKPEDPDFKEWLRRRTEISRLVQRALEEAMAAGHVRHLDPRIAAEMLLGMLRGVNRYRSRHDTLDDLVAAVVDVFLCGAATTAGRRCAGNGRKRMWT